MLKGGGVGRRGDKVRPALRVLSGVAAAHARFAVAGGVNPVVPRTFPETEQVGNVLSKYLRGENSNEFTYFRANVSQITF